MSPLERVSETMRTFLVWRERVTISPLKSLPDYWKVPMVAIVVLLTELPKPPLAASIAVERRRSGRLHPNGTAALAQDGESRTCCPARNAAELQGKKFGEAVAGSGQIGVRPA